jgi:hypothetical protein
MSGGALNYTYRGIEDAAYELNRRATCIEHRAMVTLLVKVAKAMKDIEWVISEDASEGSDLAAIRAVLPEESLIDQAKKELMEAMREAERILNGK